MKGEDHTGDVPKTQSPYLRVQNESLKEIKELPNENLEQ
jgi:hypothetical protein